MNERLRNILLAAGLSVGAVGDSAETAHVDPPAIDRAPAQRALLQRETDPLEETSHGDSVTDPSGAGQSQDTGVSGDQEGVDREAEMRSTVERVLTAVRSVGGEGRLLCDETVDERGRVRLTILARADSVAEDGGMPPHLPMLVMSPLENGRFAAQVLMPEPIAGLYLEDIKEENIPGLADRVSGIYGMALRRLKSVEDNVTEAGLSGESADRERRVQLNQVHEFIDDQLNDIKTQY